jgi:MoaA/NifB/PqqE/SkfB family radical SAM enzyme
VLFNSNGLLLTAEKAALLIDCALDELRLSMDAATPATYAAMRGTNAFAQLMANLSTLMRLKQRARLERPRVSVWMVGSRENISELPALIGLAARAGIAEVYLQRLVYPLDGPGYGLAERGRAVVDPEPQVQSLLAESSELSRRLGVTLNASGLNDPAQCLKLYTENEAPWRRCRRPWEVAYITAWGNALPCCIAPFATRDYASLIMGNALERNLADIWNGPRYREFRRRHQSADPPQNCRGCGVEWSL